MSTEREQDARREHARHLSAALDREGFGASFLGADDQRFRAMRGTVNIDLNTGQAVVTSYVSSSRTAYDDPHVWRATFSAETPIPVIVTAAARAAALQ